MAKRQVFGIGCHKCRKRADHAEGAARQLGLAYEAEEVTDTMRIVDFGVMVPVLTRWQCEDG